MITMLHNTERKRSPTRLRRAVHGYGATGVSNDSDGSITAVFQRLRAGNGDSATEFWNRFFPRLNALAQKVLAGRELPLGAEDAVQHAFYLFFRQVEQGHVNGDLHRDELWKLLSIATAQIARKQRRNELALKRGGGRVHFETDLTNADGQGIGLDDFFNSVPAPDCDQICADLMSLLDEDLREVAILRLAGYSNVEIKDIVGYPLRSIERRMQLIRAVWDARVDQ